MGDKKVVANPGDGEGESTRSACRSFFLRDGHGTVMGDSEGRPRCQDQVTVDWTVICTNGDNAGHYLAMGVVAIWTGVVATFQWVRREWFDGPGA